jgi:hypothetical protein
MEKAGVTSLRLICTTTGRCGGMMLAMQKKREGRRYNRPSQASRQFDASSMVPMCGRPGKEKAPGVAHSPGASHTSGSEVVS